MRPEAPNLPAQYADALEEYLRHGGEAALLRANELGRQALSGGLGVLDAVTIHHASLTRLLSREDPWGRNGDPLGAAAQFLSEVLSPFEITHKGFREATDTLARAIRFNAVVCHELRTPLTSILNSAGMLQEVLQADPSTIQAKLLANVLAGANILKARTDDLMDLVGFQSGTLSLKLKPVDVAPLLREVVGHMEMEVTRAGMELRVDAPQQLALVNADQGRLEQVVSNLVQNAIKYASDGHRMDVRAYASAKGLVIEVQDYGKGISHWDRIRLFQPFFRVPEARNEVPGLGIGLALCRQIVELHRGSITMESERGKGSLFRITLPLATAPQGPGGGDESTGRRGRARDSGEHQAMRGDPLAGEPGDVHGAREPGAATGGV